MYSLDPTFLKNVEVLSFAYINHIANKNTLRDNLINFGNEAEAKSILSVRYPEVEVLESFKTGKLNLISNMGATYLFN